jgi:hypothetical protein
MGYGVFKTDGAWPPSAPVDGEPIGWHYRASEDECEGGEVYVEDMPEGMSQPRWDGAKGEPRFRTEAELAEVERDETTLRVAGEAQEALTSIFVNPNDALVMVAAALHKLSQGEELTTQESQALGALAGAYERGLQKKAEIASADPKDLGGISWEEPS